MISINKKKLIRQLQTKKMRDSQSRFVAEGRKLVADLIAGGMRPNFIATVEGSDAMAGVALPAGVECVQCTEAEMKEVSGLRTPSPVLAVFDKPDHSALARRRPQSLALVLDEVQDPGNLGTIIRIADWFGIGLIVCSDTCADAFGPKVVQATMGALARVAVVEVDLADYLKINAEQWHLPVCGTFLEGRSIYQAALPEAALIVMGNEGNGISPTVAQYVTDKLFIPSYPPGAATSESLNVATATAVVCSEFRRRLQ